MVCLELLFVTWLVVSTPLKNISQLVNWDDYSKYMGNEKMFQKNTNQVTIVIPALDCNDLWSKTYETI